MKRPQITPGPWKLSEDEMKVFQTSNVYNSEGHTITLGSSALTQLQRKANARAVAAIPALLEALELADTTLQRIAPDGSRATKGTRDVITAAFTLAGYEF